MALITWSAKENKICFSTFRIFIASFVVCIKDCPPFFVFFGGLLDAVYMVDTKFFLRGSR